VRTRLLTITLAAVLALLGVVAILAYVRQANERAVNGLKAETVVVALTAIPAGTSLNQAEQGHLLSTEKVPVSSLTTPAVQSVTTENEHLVMSGSVAKGQVILQNMLAKADTASGSVPVLPLPQGDIGVTMEVCLDADVAGYVQPGSYIAVFDTIATGGSIQYTCTSHLPPTNPGKITTSVVVPRVEVLSVTAVSSQSTSSAAGQVADAPTNSASSPSSDGEVLVTLAATSQAQAENLILISNAGYPTFGLLTTGSVANVDSPFINSASQYQP
jgi:pilus assembly protein CpaB